MSRIISALRDLFTVPADTSNTYASALMYMDTVK